MSKEPKFKVVESHGEFEIREYENFLIAEVEVPGERAESLKKGFRILAAFIFGKNQQKAKIAMSIPVTQQGIEHSWKIRFVMPEEYNMQSIPLPNDPEVKISTITSQRAAVVVFSGTPTDKKIEMQTRKLEEFCKKQQLQTVGSAIFAFYNPPWTLPFLRRNEVMYVLSSSEK